MTDCERIEALALDYLEGELDGDARTRFEQHLNRCSACSARVRADRAILDGYRGIEGEDVGVERAARVTTAAASALGAAPVERSLWMRALGAALTAAAAALAIWLWTGRDGGGFEEHLRAAQAHHSAGRWAEASERYERALSEAKVVEAPGVLYALGSLYIELGRFDRANQRLRTFILEFPGDPRRRDALWLRAEALEGLGRDHRALEVYSQVAREFGDGDATRRARELSRDLGPDPLEEELRALGYAD